MCNDISDNPSSPSIGTVINPATGLAMVSDSTAGMDMDGNPYGLDWNDLWSASDNFSSDFGGATDFSWD